MPQAYTSALPVCTPLLLTDTDVVKPEPLPAAGRGFAAAPGVSRDSPRGAARNGTRSAYRPAPPVVGVATTAPRIVTRVPKLDASAAGSAATCARLSDSVTCTV